MDGDISIRGRELPVVVWDVSSSREFIDGVIDILCYAYRITLHESP